MKENIITVWVVTIILVITSLLLPTITTYANDEDNRFYMCVNYSEDGIPKKVERYPYFNGTSKDLKFIKILFKTNNYNGNGKVAFSQIGVLVNPTDSPLEYYYSKNDKSTIGANSFAWISNAPDIISPMCFTSSNSHYYVDLGNEKFTGALFEQYCNDICMNNIISDNVKKISDDLVWDEDIQDFINPNIKYDLEIVKGVKVTIPECYIHSTWHEMEDNITTNDEYVIRWEPSEDLISKSFYRHIEVEITQIHFGSVQHYIWSEKKQYSNLKQLVASPFAYKKIWKGDATNDEWLDNQLTYNILGLSGSSGKLVYMYSF